MLVQRCCFANLNLLCFFRNIFVAVVVVSIELPIKKS